MGFKFSFHLILLTITILSIVVHYIYILVLQVRLFDSTHYLKAFAVGDVWVAVGWSSDVLPVVKRMSNIAVVVPKSGSSLWADLWVYSN